MNKSTHIPSDQIRGIVLQYSAAGIRIKDIARRVGLTQSELLKHYRYELQKGRIDATAEIASVLYQQAIEGNIPACIFWLKTQGKWREADKMKMKIRSNKVEIKPSEIIHNLRLPFSEENMTSEK